MVLSNPHVNRLISRLRTSSDFNLYFFVFDYYAQFSKMTLHYFIQRMIFDQKTVNVTVQDICRFCSVLIPSEIDVSLGTTPPNAVSNSTLQF